MRKKILPSILGFLIVLALFSFGGLVWWQKNISEVSNIDEKVNFIVPKGLSAMQVANKLYEEGLIRSPLAFKIYVQISNRSEKINAGEFKLGKNMTLPEIVESLGRGPVELWVTVPEGLRREEIAVKFIDGLELDSDQAGIFAEEFLVASEGKEGYLFPDTYLLPKDVTAQAVVDKMLSTFEKKVDQEIRAKAEKSDRTLNDHLIMASIIERETKTDEERPVVAGILWKRLETDGWLLQADATVQYGVGSVNCRGREITCEQWWPVLTKRDLETQSPYNSYLIDSLPPAPIANPGLSALSASISPTSSGYWFYIHSSDGVIHYAKDINEHNVNISKYLGK